jgi:ribosomal protein S18 acetylase RimI-like enzyme
MEAIRVYYKTWGWDWEESYNFFMRYSHLPDYLGLVAVYDGDVVGMTFGALGKRGQWWFDKVAYHVECGYKNPALIDAFMLVELAVLDEYRDLGIGTALHDTLLASQPYRRALLSTEVTNGGARRLYERLGWQYLHPGFVFSEGGPSYAIMHKELAPHD